MRKVGVAQTRAMARGSMGSRTMHAGRVVERVLVEAKQREVGLWPTGAAGGPVQRSMALSSSFLVRRSRLIIKATSRRRVP